MRALELDRFLGSNVKAHGSAHAPAARKREDASGGSKHPRSARADAVGGRKTATAVHLLCCSDFTAAKSAARRRSAPTASSRTKLESWSSCSLPSTSCTGSTAKLPKARRFLGTPRRRQSPSVTCLRHFAVHRGARDFLLQAQALVTCEKE